MAAEFAYDFDEGIFGRQERRENGQSRFVSKMTMDLTNETDMDSALLRQLVEFARPPGLDQIAITFTHKFLLDDPNCGGFYQHDDHSIFVRIPPNGELEIRMTDAEKEDFRHRMVKAYTTYRNEQKAEGKRLSYMRGFDQWWRAPMDDKFHSVSIRIANRTEQTLKAVAHELRHQQQAEQADQIQMVYGANKAFSERDAAAYAVSRVRHWRRR